MPDLTRMLATGATARQLDEASIAAMFTGRYRIRGDCWEYTGYRLNGYGQIKHDGRTQLLSRVVLQMTLGRPLEADALHRCDNPPCFRPSHLYEGTDADNVADRIARGRNATGERHGRAKLTVALVRQLRADRQRGVSYRALAATYGITHQAARSAALGRTWRSA